MIKNMSPDDKLKRLKLDSRINSGSDVTYIIVSIIIIAILALDYTGYMETHHLPGFDQFFDRKIFPPPALIVVLLFIWARIITRIIRAKKVLKLYDSGKISADDIKIGGDKVLIFSLPFATDDTPWYKAKRKLWIALLAVFIGFIVVLKWLGDSLGH